MRRCPAIVTGLRRAGFRGRMAEIERSDDRRSSPDSELAAETGMRPTLELDWRAACDRQHGPIPIPASRYNLVVLGAGTAGLVTAAGAAALGAKVALVERNLLGGDCLNFGCVPSKALLRSARFYADARQRGAVHRQRAGAIRGGFCCGHEAHAPSPRPPRSPRFGPAIPRPGCRRVLGRGDVPRSPQDRGRRRGARVQESRHRYGCPRRPIPRSTGSKRPGT